LLLLLLVVPYVESQIPATLKLRSSFLWNVTVKSLDYWCQTFRESEMASTSSA
jgi:hypothetical protein